METSTNVLSPTNSSATFATSAESAALSTTKVIPRSASTLEELREAFLDLEREENPDRVLPLKELRMTEQGTIEVPAGGDFALTQWAKHQLSSKLGICWEKWFALLSPAERADEVNRRLSRSSQEVRLRTATGLPEDAPEGASGSLRAFVSPTYSPIPDSLMSQMLIEVLEAGLHEVHRVLVTDRTVSYVVAVGGAFRPGSAEVGDLRGGLIVRNSSVGYASLLITAHLERLICKNGMTVPIDDPILLSLVHRGVSEGKIREQLSIKASDIGGQLAEGARRLLAGRTIILDETESAFLAILKRAKLPRKHLSEFEAAYAAEPEPTAYGVVQAVTRASQVLPPEARYDLERAASAYLAAALDGFARAPAALH